MSAPRAAQLILALSLMLALTAPWLAHDPDQHDPVGLQAPSLPHPLGTDQLGRDVATRLLWGTRLTLGMGFGASVLATGFGLVLGLLATRPDSRILAPLIRRVLDAWLALPATLIALLCVALAGNARTPWTVAFAAGLAGAPSMARFTYTALRALYTRPYVDAAYAIGAPPNHILLRHVLPNAQATLRVFATMQISWSLLHTSGLAFLGLAGPPGLLEWGMQLAEARVALLSAPWVAAAPALALTLIVWAVNTLGDTPDTPARSAR